MNKKELLKELYSKVNAGEISREEVFNNIGPSPYKENTGDKKPKKTSHFPVTKMLYILGAAIVIIGIVILVAQIWDDIGSSGRIVVTLGLGLLIAVSGSLLMKQKPNDNIGAIFHFIGGMLIPGGAVVTIFEINQDFVSLWPITLSFGAIFLFYLTLNAIHKHPILTFFTIANGTAFIYLVVEAMVEGPFYRHEDLYAYLTMVIGASYLLLAHAFRASWNRRLVETLNFFGSVGFLGAAFSQVFDSLPWQLSFFLFVLVGLGLSVYMKSRIILIISTLFLIAHISYITSEYFANSLGWPVSLVVLGFIFIGLGYISFNINKKYIGEPS